MLFYLFICLFFRFFFFKHIYFYLVFASPSTINGEMERQIKIGYDTDCVPDIVVTLNVFILCIEVHIELDFVSYYKTNMTSYTS